MDCRMKPSRSRHATRLLSSSGSSEPGCAGSRQVSFVHPKRVPQMADAEAVMEGLPEREDVTYIGLVLNEKGAERAVRTRVSELGIVVAASDTFGRRNQNQTTAEAVATALNVMRHARAHGRTSQACISVALGCPFEGRIPFASVVEIAEKAPRWRTPRDRIGRHDWCRRPR